MIDMRSDTVTQPTQAMRQAMASATVGDDVYGEDPSINELEALAARMLGKQAALFVASGTMGNLIALLTHTHGLRAAEVIVEASSHIFVNEVAGAASLGGIQLRPVAGEKGVMHTEDIRDAIRMRDIHYPITSLICVENTHNAAGGVAQPIAKLEQLRSLADERNLPVHMDGARLFNAAVSLDVAVERIACFADSVSVCLSKGLCAPVGAVLCADEAFIALARRYRKMLGGGMRQAGILAAAGILALQEQPSDLQRDHARAYRLAQALAQLPGMQIDLDTVQTNIIRYRTQDPQAAIDFAQDMLAEGVCFGPGRLVTHAYISDEDVDAVIAAARRVWHG